MHQCLKNHTRLAGCSIVSLTTAVELLGLCFYLAYYQHYLSQRSDLEEERGGPNGLTMTPEDPGGGGDDGGGGDGRRRSAGSSSPSSSSSTASPREWEQRKLDPGAVIGVTITFISVLGKELSDI